jgi:GNAT superfamily N-acetyltransferase
VFVVGPSSTIVGFCTVYFDVLSVRYGQRAWVEDLAVEPTRRSRGVGATLLTTAMGWARTQGATHLELDSAAAREHAHRFYERHSPTVRSVCFRWHLPETAAPTAPGETSW